MKSKKLILLLSIFLLLSSNLHAEVGVKFATYNDKNYFCNSGLGTDFCYEHDFYFKRKKEISNYYASFIEDFRENYKSKKRARIDNNLTDYWRNLQKDVSQKKYGKVRGYLSNKLQDLSISNSAIYINNHDNFDIYVDKEKSKETLIDIGIGKNIVDKIINESSDNIISKRNEPIILSASLNSLDIILLEIIKNEYLENSQSFAFIKTGVYSPINTNFSGDVFIHEDDLSKMKNEDIKKAIFTHEILHFLFIDKDYIAYILERGKSGKYDYLMNSIMEKDYNHMGKEIFIDALTLFHLDKGYLRRIYTEEIKSNSPHVDRTNALIILNNAISKGNINYDEFFNFFIERIIMIDRIDKNLRYRARNAPSEINLLNSRAKELMYEFNKLLSKQGDASFITKFLGISKL